jgi:hypothetical protein
MYCEMAGSGHRVGFDDTKVKVKVRRNKERDGVRKSKKGGDAGVWGVEVAGVRGLVTRFSPRILTIRVCAGAKAGEFWRGRKAVRDDGDSEGGKGDARTQHEDWLEVGAKGKVWMAPICLVQHEAQQGGRSIR